VIRYSGNGLPAKPALAVLANDAIGNFVVVTPLLQMLRAQIGPSLIHLYSGPRTSELQSKCELIDGCFEFLGHPCGETLARFANKYDLVVNVERTPMAMFLATFLAEGRGLVCGPAIDPEGRGELPFLDDLEGRLWQDPQWTAPDLASRYPFLETPFIGEIFCRLCYLKGPVPSYRVPIDVPAQDSPEVLISTAASLPEKLWTVDKWASLIHWLNGQGLAVGLLGAKPSVQARHWRGSDEEERILAETRLIDLRGAFPLPQVVGLMTKCRLVVTVDNGIMHLAAASGRPAVALFRHGIHRLWLPPTGTVDPVTPEPGAPVATIPLPAVQEAISHVLQLRSAAH